MPARAPSLSVNTLVLKLAIAVSAAFALLCAAQFRAQSPAPQPTAAAALPSFDVISVKPNNSNSNAGNIQRTDDGIHIVNMSLAVLIRFAYRLDFDGQMINVPEWTRNANYDIDARVAPEDVAKFKALTQPQEMQMLTGILAERFKLTVQHEDREMPVYDLVVAKGGLKSAVKPAGPAEHGWSVSTGDNHVSMKNAPITSLVSALSRLSHRTVIDKTGLTGKYDLELKFTPDFADPAMAQADKEAAEASARAGDDSEAPTLFTAVQEQLGLRLVSAKGPVDCIVIDHIERPSEN